MKFRTLLLFLFITPMAGATVDPSLCPPVSKEKLAEANQELNDLEAIAQISKDFDDYDKNVGEHLTKLSAPGNARFLNSTDGQWNLDSFQQMTRAGEVNDGLFRGQKKGETWFIKKLGSNQNRLNDRAAMSEYLRAKIVHSLGMGPEVHLVVKDGAPYLVMHEVRGLNIKDIVTGRGPADLVQRVNGLLGTSARTEAEAKKLYAQAILKDKDLMDSMQAYAKRLKKYGMCDSCDFQFMVAPRSPQGPRDLGIIDTGGLNRVSVVAQQTGQLQGDPVVNMNNYIAQLRALAAAP